MVVGRMVGMVVGRMVGMEVGISVMSSQRKAVGMEMGLVMDMRYAGRLA